MFTKVTIGLVLSAQAAMAHIQMTKPQPLKSTFNSYFASSGDVDYSMTSPLLPDGSDFPCKGYLPSAAGSPAVTTLKAGESFDVQTGGTATHGGGSCQFSLSYDGGKNFVVLASVIGGCPLAANYKVPVPANIPSCKKCIFSWSWFNKIGNREMYQNCAVVDVQGTGSQSYTGPKMYTANIQGGSCVTIENESVVFNNGGPSIQYNDGYSSGSKPSNYAGCDNSGSSITVYGNGSVSKNEPTENYTSAPSTTSATADSTTEKEAEPTSKPEEDDGSDAEITSESGPEATSSPAPAPATTTRGAYRGHRGGQRGQHRVPARLNVEKTQVLAAAPTSNGGSASIRCPTRYTFELCNNAKCTNMGKVAPGTACVDGKIQRD